jgi:hypothetical protein
MKCVKSIKSTKNVEVGTIKRINDRDADSEVKSGYWKYIPKSEYKSVTRKPKNVEQPANVESSPEPKNTNPKKSKNAKNSK